MGYAGITGPDDIQVHTDPYFNYKSIEDILDYVSTQSCYSEDEMINNAPFVNAGLDYVIPIGTAYELKGEGDDLDKDETINEDNRHVEAENKVDDKDDENNDDAENSE